MKSFERISVKPCYCPFNNIEHINLNLLSINKRHIKNTQILLFMKSNTSLDKILLIHILTENSLFVLVFMI